MVENIKEELINNLSNRLFDEVLDKENSYPFISIMDDPEDMGGFILDKELSSFIYLILNEFVEELFGKQIQEYISEYKTLKKTKRED